MAEATARLVAGLRCSGFLGFDFLVEEGTGHAYFMECNARPTPSSHLGAHAGVDLCSALHARLAGQALPAQTQREQERVIALFPREWERDPHSPILRTVDHDVPWDDPELVKALVSRIHAHTAAHPSPL
jgi:hypothetical protein